MTQPAQPGWTLRIVVSDWDDPKDKVISDTASAIDPALLQVITSNYSHFSYGSKAVLGRWFEVDLLERVVKLRLQVQTAKLDPP